MRMSPSSCSGGRSLSRRLSSVSIFSVSFVSSFKGPFTPGGYKKCRLPWLTNSALVYDPKVWRRGGRGLIQWVQRYTGAQINFGDLTIYLTYVLHQPWIFRSLDLAFSIRSNYSSFADKKAKNFFSLGTLRIYVYLQNHSYVVPGWEMGG